MKVVAIIVSMLALTACSTVAGVGKDIQSSAEWTKQKMGGSK
jgi:predicted small secreted protein